MSYNGVDQMDYMVDGGDVADSIDGIDEEYHAADDANLDEYDMVSHISGICVPCLLLSAFFHYSNESLSDLKRCKPTEKGGSYFEFFHNTRLVKPTILHFQLRNLVWATSKHDVYLISNYSVMHWSSLLRNLTEVLNFSGHIVPTERNPGTFLEGFTRTQLSTLAVKDRFLVLVASMENLSQGVGHAKLSTIYISAIEWNPFHDINNDCGHTSISPDGKLVAVVGDDVNGLLVDARNGKDKTCRVWDLRNLHTPVAILKGNIGAVRSIRFSADGQFLVVAEPADFVHIYNTKENFGTRQEIDFFGEISGVSLSPDDESIYIGIWDHIYQMVVTDVLMGSQCFVSRILAKRRDSGVWSYGQQEVAITNEFVPPSRDSYVQRVSSSAGSSVLKPNWPVRSDRSNC
ncbi:hypothetical protein Sango_2403800 [Sesamum angolense]|uniref:Uncharacterized protein n=1 Tax=Sesamum angolense TaxID=2727404 RepID=A0AAE1W751_9LAMI|nr:hypothetical protein Sango_2403800 [Sesamum angolense]